MTIHYRGGDKMEWYVIPGTNDAWSINKSGKIKHNKTGRVSYGDNTSQGYKELRIRTLGKVTFRKLIHVIMGEMFLDKPDTEADWVVDHKDNDKQHNELHNLQYLTRSDNFRKGQEVRDASTTFKPVNQYSLDGTLIARYDSITQACVALGVARGPMIGYACKGSCSTNNCNTAYGFKWRFVDDDIVLTPQ